MSPGRGAVTGLTAIVSTASGTSDATCAPVTTEADAEAEGNAAALVDAEANAAAARDIDPGRNGDTRTEADASASCCTPVIFAEVSWGGGVGADAEITVRLPTK